jgi:Ni/Co efflux regulator RcnB
MKRNITACLLAASILAPAFFVPAATAQPARIEFGRAGTGWVDQNGQPSRRERTDAEDRTMERRDDRLDQREAAVRQDRQQLNQDRKNWRDTRRGATWDQGVHNGYYNSRNQWRYGQPSRAQMRQRGFSMGYRPWTRGQSLGGYNQRFVELDYRGHNLRAPPRGYRWVEDDRGDYLLAAIVGGLIAQVIINSPR